LEKLGKKGLAFSNIAQLSLPITLISQLKIKEKVGNEEPRG